MNNLSLDEIKRRLLKGDYNDTLTNDIVITEKNRRYGPKNQIAYYNFIEHLEAPKNYSIMTLDNDKCGSCNACGGNLNIIKQKNWDSLTEQINSAIKLISGPEQKNKIFGSFVYRSQYYPSDIDIHEVVDTIREGDDIYQKMYKILKNIVTDVSKKEKIFFSEIKAGIDERYHIDLYDPQFRFKVYDLFRDKLLTRDEIEKVNGLYYLWKKKQDNDAYDELKEFIRQKYTLRWSKDEIMKGYKILIGNKKIQFVDAIKVLTPIKIDIWAPINGRYIEITNFYFLVKYNKKKQTFTILNADIKNYVASMLEQIVKLSSKLFYNPFKMAKRIWGIARQTKNIFLLKRLTPLFQGSAAIINKILAEIEVIILMYENVDKLPYDIIQKQIDEFKLRLSYIYDIDFDDEKVYQLIDKVIGQIRNRDKVIEILLDVEEYLKSVRNEYSERWLRERSLYPAPSFLFNIPEQQFGNIEHGTEISIKEANKAKLGKLIRKSI